MNLNKPAVSTLAACTLLLCSSFAMAEQKTATFTANITADVPNDFKLVTKDGGEDTISLAFPDSSFNGDQSVFKDQFKNVKISGTSVGSDTSVDVSADNLTLKSADGKSVGMMVMFADDKGHVPTMDDVDLDTMVITDTAQHVTLDKTHIATLSSFYIGYNLNGDPVMPGHYTGSIILTAAAEL